MQPEDTYYQIINNEYVSLAVHFETIDGDYKAVPEVVVEGQPYYPTSITTDEGWKETHYCPICNKEYTYIVPCTVYA